MNSHARVLSILLFIVGVLLGQTAGAKTGIVNTKHNLSITGPGEIKATSEERICVFCHTPHNANPQTPLWNEGFSSVTYDPNSLYSSSTMVAGQAQPTEQAQQAIAEEVVNIVQTFMRTGTVPNCVNLCHRSPARFQMIVHHLDRVGVLARVLAALERHGINVEEMENTIFAGAVAACCALRLGSRPDPEVLDEIRRTPRPGPGHAHLLRPDQHPAP